MRLNFLTRRTSRNMKPGAVFALGFIAIILIGAFLLALPISSKSGEFTSVLTTIFTATSATCVTGLVLVDTYTHWSTFGQAVILIMIQLGGLGFMTLATLISLMLKRKISMRERIVMTTSLNIDDLSGVVKLTRHILLGTLIFEGIGAIILSIRFSMDFGIIEGIKKGIFHSISAFCNAGFDLMGMNTPFSSLTAYATDFTVNVTIMALIIIGGIGFFVWGDIFENRGKKVKRYATHTKVILVTTIFLIVIGAILFLFFEFNNDATIGTMDFKDKVLASVFQSVTTRTAGFNTIDQAQLTGPSLALTNVLMLIGGSPGSTAGGIKTMTIAVLVITAYCTLFGYDKPRIFGRSIPNRAILNSITMLFVGIFITAFGTFVISYTDGVIFNKAMYEAISAFGTVGLSMGITPTLGILSKITLIVMMYLGRIGVLTLGVTVLMHDIAEPKIKYPEDKFIIG